MDYIKVKNSINFDASFCNCRGGKMIKVEFKVSQGSVATLLRCGKNHDKCFTENFLLNLKVKEF